MKGTLEVTTPTDQEIMMTREFDAPRQMVFDALTQPALVRRWLLGPDGWTLPVCEIDLRAGGSLRYVWRNAQGTEMGMSGTYREIVEPSRIVHTELFDEDWTGGEAVVTNELAERAGRTVLTMTVRYSSKEARDGALRSGMETGIVASYDRLADILSGT